MTDGVPKYITVRDNLRKRVELMQPGEQLPSELELCKQYNVSRITLRHAIDNLKHEGLLVREQGRGTFRAEHITPSMQRDLISDQISGFYQQYFHEDSQTRVQVLMNEVIQDDSVVTQLGLDSNAELICLKRLRYVDDVASHYSVMYLPAARFPKILTQNFENQTLMLFLGEAYGVKLCENEVTVRVERICSSVSDLLKLEEGTAILAVESLVRDAQGNAVAFAVTLYTPRNSEIHFRLHEGSRP